MYMTYLRQDERRRREEDEKREDGERKKGVRSPTFVVIITVTAPRRGYRDRLSHSG